MLSRVPEYEIIDGDVDDYSLIRYNGLTIHVSKISFTKPPWWKFLGRATIHVNYELVDCKTDENEQFKQALAKICIDVLEKNLAWRKVKKNNNEC